MTGDGGWDSPATSMADSSFTSADFHSVVHKQIVQAVYETLVDGKIAWDLVVPFLDTAREICRSDFEEASRIRLHSLRAEEDEWIEAEEAYLGIAVADRDTGQDWLSETYWLSDIVLADGNAEQVRRTVAALERSLAKINAWLAENEKGGPDESEPPSLPADS